MAMAPEQYAQWIVSNSDKRGTPEFETVSQAYRLSRAKSAPVEKIPVYATPGERASMAFTQTVLGPGQEVSHGIQALPGMGGYAQPVDDTIRALAAARKSGNPPGFEIGDVTEFVGENAPLVVAGLARAPAMLRGIVQTGGKFRQAAQTGAAIGGGAALVSPETSQDYAGAKAQRFVTDAGAGAILGPFAARAGEMIVNAVKRIGRAVSPQSIDVNIVLQQNGIDPASVSNGFKQEVDRQIQATKGTGGSINSEAMTNAAAADRLGVRQLMSRGQIERNPAQFGQEESLRNMNAGGALATQMSEANARLGQRLEGMQTGVAVDNPTAAGRVAAPLRAFNRERDTGVTGAYNAVKTAPGRDKQLNGAQIANDVYADLQRGYGAPLPSNLAGPLNQWATSGVNPTVEQANQMLKAANRAWSNTDDALNHSLGVLKQKLSTAIEQSGTAAGSMFKAATQQAAKQFRELDRLPALKAVADGATPDALIDKFILGGGKEASADNVKALIGFLGNKDPGAVQQIRTQVVQKLRKAAGFTENTQSDKWNAGRYDEVLEGLKQSGKLGVLFDGPQIQALNDIARVGKAINQRPQSISGTGLAGAARASELFGTVMGLVAKTPGVGKAVEVAKIAVSPIVTGIRNSNALSRPTYASAGALVPRYRNNLAALGGAVTPLYPSNE